MDNAEVSWIDEELLASQDRLCFMEFVIISLKNKVFPLTVI
jgi:hypothetical protein